MLRLLPRKELELRKKILAITAPKDRQDKEQQEIQEGIYSMTGLSALMYMTIPDAHYLLTRLPKATREMMRLTRRAHPEFVTMYDLRHSLVSCAGADAGIKITMADKIARMAMAKIRERLARGDDTPLEMLELGSGLSDVTAMVCDLLGERLMLEGHRNALELFHVTNVEYETNTGETARDMLLYTGLGNTVSVRFGPELGDATVLKGLEDNSFDMTWSSLFLGAFEATGTGKDLDSPKARAVLDQAWRVTKHGGTVMHTDFVHAYDPRGGPRAQARTFKTPKANTRFLRAMPSAMVLGTCGIGDFVRDLTDEEFEYWKWFDGGEFAARMICAEQGSMYSAVEVLRFAGKPDNALAAAAAEFKLFRHRPRPQDHISEDEFTSALAACRARYVAFCMTTAVVTKGGSRVVA